MDPKHDHRKRCAVLHHLRTQIMKESHSGPIAGHFSGEKLYKLLVTHWWWQGMYSDVMSHCMSCPQCAIVNAAGRVNKPPPNTSLTTISDYWSGHYGPPTH